MQFELIHYLLIVLIWVAVFNLCYMLLKNQDKEEYPTQKRKASMKIDLPKVKHNSKKKKGKQYDPFYDDLFAEEDEGGDLYE